MMLPLRMELAITFTEDVLARRMALD
jgi:hypothetical protein